MSRNFPRFYVAALFTLITACGDQTDSTANNNSQSPDVQAEAQRVAGTFATLRNLSGLYLHALLDFEEWEQLDGQQLACETSGTVAVSRTIRNDGEPRAVYEYTNCIGPAGTVNGYLDAYLVQDQRERSGFFQTQVVIDIDINGESYQYENRIVTSRASTQSANYTMEIVPYSGGRYTNADGNFISRWTNQIFYLALDNANHTLDFGESVWGGTSSGGGQLIVRPAPGFKANAFPGIGMVAIGSPQNGSLTFTRAPNSGPDVDGEIRTSGGLANIEVTPIGNNFAGGIGQFAWDELLASPRYDWFIERGQ